MNNLAATGTSLYQVYKTFVHGGSHVPQVSSEWCETQSGGPKSWHSSYTPLPQAALCSLGSLWHWRHPWYWYRWPRRQSSPLRIVGFLMWLGIPMLTSCASHLLKLKSQNIKYLWAWATWPKTSTLLRLARTRNSSCVGCFQFRYKHGLTVPSIGVLHTNILNCEAVQLFRKHYQTTSQLFWAWSVQYLTWFMQSNSSCPVWVNQGPDTIVILYWQFCLD